MQLIGVYKNCFTEEVTMNPLGKKELLYFYNRHLRDFGDSPQALRWTPEGQRLRYEILVRIAGIEESMKNVLKKLFGLSREALHVNLLTYYIPQRNVELFYVKPEEILRFVITELSPSVILRHGTIKEDFFLSIYSP